MARIPIRIAGREVVLHKCSVDARFGLRNVLTNDPWTFTDLWLRRQGLREAVLLWEQARRFYDASRDLPIQSAPLLLYYSYMNAAKALLTSKGLTYGQKHGASARDLRGGGRRISLSNEGVKVGTYGIAPSLASYFGESLIPNIHSLKTLLRNIVAVHRTYSLTFSSERELFAPLKSAKYVHDDATGLVGLEAEISDGASWPSVSRRLPGGLIRHPEGGRKFISASTVPWASHENPSGPEVASLQGLHRDLRKSLHYLNGAQTLWYARLNGQDRLDRQALTLNLLAMHRLSEICRYRPFELHSFMQGQSNWLISEYISMSPAQFIDEISAEITGQQIMIPNVRGPN